MEKGDFFRSLLEKVSSLEASTDLRGVGEEVYIVQGDEKQGDEKEKEKEEELEEEEVEEVEEEERRSRSARREEKKEVEMAEEEAYWRRKGF